MARHPIAATALIPSPPADVYAVLADYHDGHALIIPRPPFVSLAVEQGGTGAGTVIRVETRVMGRTQGFRAVVSEPDPGRVLVETNSTGFVTTFTVEPRDGGLQSQVTISTMPPARRWPLEAVEGWIMRRFLRPVFARELALLADVAAERTAPVRG